MGRGARWSVGVGCVRFVVGVVFDVCAIVLVVVVVVTVCMFGVRDVGVLFAVCVSAIAHDLSA